MTRSLEEVKTMATMNVSLPDPMKAWVEAQTRDGRYSNASDYVRDLIRRDQDRQQAVAELQQLVDEGLTGGPAQRVDIEAFLARKRDKDAKTEGN
jgi:antitoxin ParD1/3/4